MKYIASVSFGKDSLCMLLLLIERGEPIDEVVFYDTGMEFEAIYKIRDRVREELEEKGIEYTELKPEYPFEYTMFEREVKKRDGSKGKGYSWCGGRCRWGTSEKKRIIRKYIKRKYGKEYKEYVGIAYDEPERIKEDEKKIYPLYDLNITESMCLEYCRSKGYKWEEDGVDLYEVLDRVSCWCCSNKNLKELRNYWKYLPRYWKELKRLQSKTERPFRNNKERIEELEERFKKEDKKH